MQPDDVPDNAGRAALRRQALAVSRASASRFFLGFVHIRSETTLLYHGTFLLVINNKIELDTERVRRSRTSYNHNCPFLSISSLLLRHVGQKPSSIQNQLSKYLSYEGNLDCAFAQKVFRTDGFNRQ